MRVSNSSSCFGLQPVSLLWKGCQGDDGLMLSVACKVTLKCWAVDSKRPISVGDDVDAVRVMPDYERVQGSDDRSRPRCCGGG